MTPSPKRAKQIIDAALTAIGDDSRRIKTLLEGKSTKPLPGSDPLVALGFATHEGDRLTPAASFAAALPPSLPPFHPPIPGGPVDEAIARHNAIADAPAHLCIVETRTEVALADRLRARGHRVVPLELSSAGPIAMLRLAQGLAAAEQHRAVLSIERGEWLLAPIAADGEHSHEAAARPAALSDPQRFMLQMVLQSRASVAAAVAPEAALADDASMIVTLRAPAPSSGYMERLEETRLLAAEMAARLASEEIEALARPDVSVSVRRNLIYATMLTGSTTQALASLPAAKITAQSTDRFDLSLINADIDVEALTKNLDKARGEGALFLLHGAPGTGKSALAAYLARRLGHEPRIVTGSSLEHSKVGETEKAIARLFQEATAKRQAVILDEADSLIMDRSLSSWNYDTAKTNEFLVWLERHREPFFMTTNHADRVDPAVKRRITLKIELLPLTPEQRRRAWSNAFNREAPDALRRLDGLSSGDFAVVLRRARILDYIDDDIRLLDDLKKEVIMRGAHKERIGFR